MAKKKTDSGPLLAPTLKRPVDNKIRGCGDDGAIWNSLDAERRRLPHRRRQAPSPFAVKLADARGG